MCYNVVVLVGTLDTLMALMDDLAKHDSFVGSICVKLAKQVVELALDAGPDESNNVVDVSKLNLDDLLFVGQANVDIWIKKFKWNAGRWDYEKSTLQSITDDIVKTAGTIDVSLRQKTQDWVVLNRSIVSAKSLATGSVLMRDVSTLLKPEQVVDTESLCTMLVVVPKNSLRHWHEIYEVIEVEDLKQMMDRESGAYAARVVMPKSCVQIAEDNENVLVTIVVLRKFLDQIKNKLKEHKFTPRDFSLEKAPVDAKEKDLPQLLARREALKGDLTRFCKAQFSETFLCWVHLKTIRVWVESVVRFSLPADFDVTLIRVDRRNSDRIRKVLHELFKDLIAEGVLDNGADETQGVPSIVSEDLYPYVFSELNLVGRVQ